MTSRGQWSAQHPLLHRQVIQITAVIATSGLAFIPKWKSGVYMLSLPLCWLTVVTKEKAHVAASASVEAPFVWIKSITVWLVVVRKASLLEAEGKVCGSESKPFQLSTDRCPSFQTTTLYYNLLDSNTIQPFAYGFKAGACCYTSFFPRHNSQLDQRSGGESTCTPLFYLGKSQSTSCTHCSDLDRLSA